MLRGIDISNHQEGLQIADLQGVEFVIVKATEGLNFVDWCCDPWIQECKRLGIPWGFYHFGRNNSAVAEAEFFLDNCYGYFGQGIPILDWEDDQSVSWVNAFTKHIYNETGIHPWIYANPWRFNQGGVDPDCGRWVAVYPNVTRPGLDFDPGELPNTEGLVACWQYASDGYVPTYSANLDVNHFFGDKTTWARYVGGVPPEQMDFMDVLENDTYKVTIERK